MKSILGRLFGFVGTLGLVAVLSSPAFADRDHDNGKGNDDNKGSSSHSAPEIDPAGLAAIGSLLVGGTLLLKSRRGDKK